MESSAFFIVTILLIAVAAIILRSKSSEIKALKIRLDTELKTLKSISDQLKQVETYADSLENQNRNHTSTLLEEKERLRALEKEIQFLKQKSEIYAAQEKIILKDLEYLLNDPQRLQQQTEVFRLSDANSKQQFELFLAKLARITMENNQLKELIKQKDELYLAVQNPFGQTRINIPELIADHLTLQYQLTERLLITKKRPAIKQAAEIKELRITLKEYIKKYKTLQYSFELLKRSIPSLEDFMEEDIAILAESTITDFSIEEDEVANWLSKEEYDALTPSERNQLALDNYHRGKYNKTKWQIGRDYEIYVGLYFESLGYKVQFFGIKEKFEDLGRDLICIKDDEVLIVQCKYWSEKKVIRENAIAQLFGTTKMYELENAFLPGIVKKIKAVLVTNISLSHKAKQFANYLGVEVQDVFPIGPYPSIKCNVSKNGDGSMNKIYHLPMDQMYDKTMIENDGEYWVSSVQKAEELGFRRARRFKLTQEKS